DYIIANSDEYEPGDDPADIETADFANVFGSLGLSKDTRNRRIFAHNGHLNSIGLELYGGELNYYKLRYKHQSAFPVTSNVTYNFKSKIGYGDSYSETTGLPFFEHFTAGGVRTVRGYERNSLGPLDSNGDPFGGSLQVIVNSEVLIPIESFGSSETFRLGLYWDAGNVFSGTDTFETDELR
ncbi:MAG: BamA/TamA family outer membrane protein, partial [Gammaproteobacteria bacterium]|nr:BamA/TamA family outer membrane protein [Gammaproteobacteria bacterium]